MERKRLTGGLDEEKVGKGKEEKQRNVEEKEVRAEARAVYFALQ